MRLLVTGGAGFIGSHLVRALLDRGDEVVVLDDLSTGRRENLEGIEKRTHFIEGDAADPATARSACAGCAVVFHQAAIPSVPRSVEDPVGTSRANVGGTLSVLAAARAAGVRRVVLASSSSIYGESEALPKEESMTTAPISPYGVAKAAGEAFARLWPGLYGVETVCLRYFNVFGPRQDPRSQYAAVVPRFIEAALAGAPATIYGDGRQTRDFTYVENVVRANLLAAEAPAERASGRAFNIAAGRETSLLDLVATLGRIVGRPLEVRHEAGRPGDIRRSVASIEAARAALGYDPAVDVEEGLRRTVAWFRERRA